MTADVLLLPVKCPLQSACRLVLPPTCLSVALPRNLMGVRDSLKFTDKLQLTDIHQWSSIGKESDTVVLITLHLIQDAILLRVYNNDV